MPDIWMDVDTAVIVPVNILPLIDDTDFKTIETAVVYNSTGLAVTWNFVTSAGVQTGVAITPTTAGVYDWSEPVADKGMYAIEIPASGGASANNNTEGYGWISGVATGVLPWRGPVIGFRAAALNDAMCDGGDNLDVNTVQWLGTACATPTVNGVPEVDLTHVAGATTNVSALATNVDAILTDTGTTLDTKINTIAADVVNIDGAAMRGTDGVYTGTPPTAAAISDAVWDETSTGHVDAGKAGAQLWTDIDAILVDTDNLQTNQGNWLTATGFSTHSAADVLATALTEGYATDGSTATLTQLLYMIWSALSEFSIAGTTITAKKLDGAATAMTFTLDDGTNPTSRTRAT